MCQCEFIKLLLLLLLLYFIYNYFFAFIIYILSLFQLVRSKASSQGKHLQTHSSTVVLSLQVQSLCSVFNKSRQPAKFAGYFMSILCLLFFGNYPRKSQNLMLSVFCSNTLQVLLHNAVNALSEVQLSKFFHLQQLAPFTLATCEFFPSPPTPKLCHLLQTSLKTLQ